QASTPDNDEPSLRPRDSLSHTLPEAPSPDTATGRGGSDRQPPGGDGGTDESGDDEEPDEKGVAYSLEIDIPRLFADLRITEEDLHRVAALKIPNVAGATSTSTIKVNTIRFTADAMRPDLKCRVKSYRAASDINEQPIGQMTIDGVLNRLRNGITARTEDVQEGSDDVWWVSVEHGMFRVSKKPGPVVIDRSSEGIMQFTEDADLTVEFDPNAEYADRAVVAVKIPGYRTIVQISPASEAVRFPHEAVLAAYNAEGGFEFNTVGSMLVKMPGFKIADKQNPHVELTANRPGGPLPREDQMARAIIRALIRLGRGSAQ
ncbi:MAG TPA: DUF84 family protein, partial [Candidatus Saccharimonadales bacterium]|nr:DUF84 family protein [Candidatus Saccharimonadales bacterium]